MADVISLNDNSIQIVFSLRDMLQMIETYMGFEARRWVETYMEDLQEGDDDLVAYTSDLEEQIEKMQKHHHETMESLRKESEKVARLIQEKDINRAALSTTTGKIGSITWRELNV